MSKKEKKEKLLDLYLAIRKADELAEELYEEYEDDELEQIMDDLNNSRELVINLENKELENE